MTTSSTEDAEYFMMIILGDHFAFIQVKNIRMQLIFNMQYYSRSTARCIKTYYTKLK